MIHINTKINFTLLTIALWSSLAFSQTSSTYSGNLVEYLTEANLRIETKVLTDYCNCTDKNLFIASYQEVAIAFNTLVNKHITQLTQLKTREAINTFKGINSKTFVNNNKDVKEASDKLSTFTSLNCTNKKAFWPATVTIAEITGIGNAIIGLINEGKKRRDTQRDKLIGILDALRIPSIQSYKCNKDSKSE